MRMRFWATIRKPAFSISALTAPVRLRSVASGLMIEKVRSIAIVYVLAKTLIGELRGLYRRHLRTASDRVTRPTDHFRGDFARQTAPSRSEAAQITAISRR